MRNAINNNPKVQLGVLGALVVLIALVLVPSMMGKKSASTAGTATSATAPSGSVAPSVQTTQPALGDASTAGATAVAPPAATVSPSALIPGPGLPRPMIDAWKHGQAVVLLIVRNHGIDDQLISHSVRDLSGDRGLTVLVVHANRVARYSRITQGVGVSQVPALVVVRPRRVSGSVPEAQVAYGFRDSQTVVQYVHDALYSGKDDLPYSPR